MSTARTPKRDRRLVALTALIAGTAVIGYLVDRLPGRSVQAVASAPPARTYDLSDLPAASDKPPVKEADPAENDPLPPPADKKPNDPHAERIEQALQAAQKKIRAKNYDGAIAGLDAARDLLKSDTRAYLLMAKALEGRKDYDAARDFYGAVIARDPYQPDAYWGVATTSEALGELDAALGAMRIFLHVQPNADPQKLRIVQARSALWEWESQLGRGPWGPSKGIPPGFTREELKRDGRGVGIKIPLPETKRPDGFMDYEIKHQDKFQLFKP